MILTFRELKKLLSYKDNRSVTKWCLKQGVAIFAEQGRKYVIQAEYEAARYRNPFKYLNEKYGLENLPQAISAHMNLFSLIVKAKTKSNGPAKYKPVGSEEADFLDFLTNLSTKL